MITDTLNGTFNTITLFEKRLGLENTYLRLQDDAMNEALGRNITGFIHCRWKECQSNL